MKNPLVKLKYKGAKPFHEKCFTDSVLQPGQVFDLPEDQAVVLLRNKQLFGKVKND